VAGALLLAGGAGCEYSKRAPESSTDGGGQPAATASTPAAAAVPDAAAPRALADSSTGILGVAIDDDAVYWSTNWSTREIRRLARNAPVDAKPTTVCSHDERMAYVERMLVDDTHVYFIARILGGGAVFRAPKAGVGGPCERVVDLAFSGVGVGAGGMTRVGKVVYVLGQNQKRGSTLLSFEGGGKPKHVAELPPETDGLTSDGTSLFFGLVDAQGTSLQKLDLAPGSKPVKLGAGGGKVAYGAGELFFFRGSYELARVAPSGGAAKPLGKGYATVLVVGDWLYTGLQGARGRYDLQKISLRDGTTTSHSLPGSPSAIAGDARDVYVAAGNTLTRFPP